jgi:formylmethanofuran dehydrogenase subunit D
MTPAAAIAMLDRQLSAHGQTVTVKNRDASVSASVRAHVRVAKEDEIAGLRQQVWWKVILSPTGLSALLPIKKGFSVTIEDTERAVELAAPIRMDDVLVRIDLMVAG